jgi:superfamily II DNA or RNA helicase
MVTVSERTVTIGIKGEPAEISALVDKFKFKHPHRNRIVAYVLYVRTTGERGWDGYIKPLQRISATEAQILRGYKSRLLHHMRELDIELDPNSRVLDSPFQHITTDDIPADLVSYEHQPDEDQREIIVQWLKTGMGIGHMATNAGKTMAFAGFAAMLKRLEPSVRVLYVTDRERLTTQVDREMAKMLPGWHITKFGGGGDDNGGNDMVVCTLAMLRKHREMLITQGWFNTFHAVMFDECFPAGTEIDGKPIEQFKIGDKVCSVEENGTVKKRIVLRVFKSRPSQLLRVKIGGKSIICTPGHQIFVDRIGYLPAFMLKPGDCVVQNTTQQRSYSDEGIFSSVPLVQESVRFNEEMGKGHDSQNWPSLLQIRMWKSLSVESCSGNDESDKPKVCFGEDEKEQSNVRRSYKGQSTCSDERQVDVEVSSGGQWQVYHSSDFAVGSIGRRVDDGTSCQNSVSEATEKTISFLQSGHRKLGAEIGNRSGRSLSLQPETAANRQVENYTFTRCRVDSVEVLEQTSDGAFGGLCPDGFVYNLEVEENHNYFANGFLVHNCHHAAAETSAEILDNIKGAFFRIGASATLKFDDPIKHDIITGLFGTILHRVEQQTLIDAGRSATPHIYLIDPPEWKDAMEFVPYEPVYGTRAWVLLQGEDTMRKGKYIGRVAERDKHGEVKMRKVKEVDKGEIVEKEVEVTIPGLHTIEIDKVEYEVDSSYCLLNRSTDECIVNNKARNELVTEWAKFFSDQGKRTLVIATRTVHVLILEAMICNAVDPELVMTMVGKDAGGKRDRTIAWFKRTKGAVLISPLIQEGVSINEIEAGVIADYVADYERADQIIGRFVRRKEGSNEVEIAWFIDRHQKRFENGCLRMFKKLRSTKGYFYYHPIVHPSDLQGAVGHDTTAILEEEHDRAHTKLGA